MSESSGSQGMTPVEFHRAEGVSDWRVTAFGPRAVFTATSFAHAAELVGSVVEAAERFGIRPDVDVRPEAVVVSIPYRDTDEMNVPATAAEFAASVSRVAAERRLIADPSRVQYVGVYVAQHSEVDVRPFFRAALGYDDFGESDAVDPLRSGPQLAFNPITGDKARRGRTHFDVFVPADQAQARVDAALAAGGRLVDDSHAPAWCSIASPDNHGVDIASWPDTYG
jgi:pterin-4a-carbinolamine dehydratase